MVEATTQKSSLTSHTVTRSRRHTVIRSHGRTVTRSQGHTITRSHSHTITRSHGHKVTRSYSHKATRSHDHAVIRSYGHTVTRSHLTIKRSFTAVHNASHYPFMCNRQLQIIKDHHLSPLKDLLGFSQEQLRTASISYNPMAFLMAIPVSKWQLFPKHLFQHWVRLALDLPFDDCERTCEACGKQQDNTGHHRATCSSRATKAWKRGHSHVVEALGNMLGIAAIGSTTKDGQIPRHVDSDRQSPLGTGVAVGAQGKATVR
jgi:hypothetical protein